MKYIFALLMMFLFTACSEKQVYNTLNTLQENKNKHEAEKQNIDNYEKQNYKTYEEYKE